MKSEYSTGLQASILMLSWPTNLKVSLLKLYSQIASITADTASKRFTKKHQAILKAPPSDATSLNPSHSLCSQQKVCTQKSRLLPHLMFLCSPAKKIILIFIFFAFIKLWGKNCLGRGWMTIINFDGWAPFEKPPRLMVAVASGLIIALSRKPVRIIASRGSVRVPKRNHPILI